MAKGLSLIFITLTFTLCEIRANPNPQENDPPRNRYERIVYEPFSAGMSEETISDIDELLKAINLGYKIDKNTPDYMQFHRLSQTYANESDYPKFTQGEQFFYQESKEQMNLLAKEKQLSLDGLRFLFNNEIVRRATLEGDGQGKGLTPWFIAYAKAKTAMLESFIPSVEVPGMSLLELLDREISQDPAMKDEYIKIANEFRDVPYNTGKPNITNEEFKNAIIMEMDQLLNRYHEKYQSLDKTYKRVNIEFDENKQLYFAEDKLNTDYIQHALGLSGDNVKEAKINFKKYIQAESILRIMQHLQKAKQSINKLDSGIFNPNLIAQEIESNNLKKIGEYFFKSYDRGIQSFKSSVFGQFSVGPLGIRDLGGIDFTFFYSLSEDFEWFRNKKLN